MRAGAGANTVRLSVGFAGTAIFAATGTLDHRKIVMIPATIRLLKSITFAQPLIAGGR